MQTQICIVSLIRIKLNSYTISKMKINTDLTTLSSLECTMIKLQINTISLRITKMTIITTVILNRKITEWTTSLMRTELSQRFTKNLLHTVTVETEQNQIFDLNLILVSFCLSGNFLMQSQFCRMRQNRTVSLSLYYSHITVSRKESNCQSHHIISKTL